MNIKGPIPGLSEKEMIDALKSAVDGLKKDGMTDENIDFDALCAVYGNHVILTDENIK